MDFFKGLFRFVFSKTFLIQLVIAITMIVILCFVALQWLESSTNHDQRIVVPSLSKKTLDEVKAILEEKDLRFEVQDSANFNSQYPRYSVIEQNPAAGNKVKENRKIYVTLNPSGYRKIEVPDVIRKTRRQVEPRLVALGFKIGTITYKPDPSDQVLQLRHKGKNLKPGDKLMKTSTIDLVIGDRSGNLRLSSDN
ncbi:PASTA domain-containing protein [Aquimarina sp. 2201CG14-23]|uniref:PASTA domain-containing protein n=1 Tax=Aquimarina mycalae TaxID=3040073 RepID=UPI0024782897|nr:PASTA domain-containing protein [Aquimarina sp. 2201CG14-23]MDH7444571.1 PASTA domain-containing protein [Aquimarina sp. 2201CG14-23]